MNAQSSAPSLAMLVDAVAHRLTTGLLAAGAIDRLRERASALPLSRSAGFELHVDAADRADIGFCFAKQPEDVAALLTIPELTPLAEAWQRLPIAEELWVELDDTLFRSSPHPGAFLRLSRGGAKAVYDAIDALQAYGAISNVTARKDVLRRCLDALPNGPFVHHAGVLPGRDPAGVRVSVGPLHGFEVLSYLDTIGWSGPAQTVAMLQHLRGDAPVRLQLTVNQGLAPELGVEWYDHHRLTEWHEPLETLARHGMLDAARARGLRLWIGQSAAHEHPHTARAVAVHGASRVVRGISHLKFAVGDSGDVKLKIYLYARLAGGGR